MEKNNQNLLQKLTQILNVDKIMSPDDVLSIRDALIGVLANNKKELESLTDETKQAVNSILDKVLTEHDTYLEKTKQIAQEAKSETTEAINSTLKSLEEVKALCKEVMECKPENGEDADEEYVIGEVLNRIKLPEYKEIVLDDGGAIVDKINSLPVNEENQIDAKHIKNLPEVKGGRVISGGVTRKIVEQMIEAAGGGTPGGSTTQLQYNNAGAFGGISGATTDGTAVTYTANNLKAADITASGSGGFLIQSNSGTDVGLFGAGGGAGATFYGGVNMGGTLSITGGDIFLNGGNVIKNNTTHLYLDASSGNDIIFRPNNGTEAGRFKSGGDFVVDTNTLYVDATNNRVGVGNTSPATTLDVTGAISMRGAGNNRLLAYSNDGTIRTQLFSFDGLGGFIGTQSNHSLFFRTNDTTRMTLDSTGLVGIGTTAPADKLHVIGDTRFSAPTVTSQLLRIRVQDSQNGVILDSVTTNGNFLFYVNGVEKSRMNASGSWALGSDGSYGPGSRLSVNGNATIGTSYKSIAGPTNGLAIEGLLGLGTTSPTHTLTLSSTSTGIALYNTADQTTNYERVIGSWSANIFTIGMTKGGSGSDRAIDIASGGTVFDLDTNGVDITRTTSGTALATGLLRISGTQTQSSGLFSGLGIAPTINQSSTAGYTALLVNPTETTTGSGTKRLLDLQVNSTSLLSVDNLGDIDWQTGAHYIRHGGAQYIGFNAGTGKMELVNGLSTGNGTVVYIAPTATSTSASQKIINISPTINQTSGTGGYTALHLNVTETATGSGTKLLADFQVGGVSKFNVDNTGVARIITLDTNSLKISTTSNSVGGTMGVEFKYNSGGANTNLARIIGYTQTGGGGDILFETAASGSSAYSTKMTLTRAGVLSVTGGITKRVVTTTDDSTAVIDVAVTDVYQLTAIANNTTFSFTGTPTDGQNFIIRYKDAGVSKTLTWTGFTAIGVTLPTSTTAGKWGYVGVTYNSAASAYHVVSVTTEA